MPAPHEVLSRWQRFKMWLQSKLRRGPPQVELGDPVVIDQELTKYVQEYYWKTLPGHTSAQVGSGIKKGYKLVTPTNQGGSNVKTNTTGST